MSWPGGESGKAEVDLAVTVSIPAQEPDLESLAAWPRHEDYKNYSLTLINYGYRSAVVSQASLVDPGRLRDNF